MKKLILFSIAIYFFQICNASNANFENTVRVFNNMLNDWDSLKDLFAEDAVVSVRNIQTMEGRWDHVMGGLVQAVNEYKLITRILEDLGNTVVSSFSDYAVYKNGCSHLSSGVAVTSYNDQNKVFFK